MELPRLQSLWEKYRDQGFEVIAIESRRETERAMEFIQQEGLGFTCVETGEDEADVVSQVFRVEGFPTSFLIDRQGRVMYHHLGWNDGDAEKLEGELLTLLDS
ncbi:MAG: TlpA family protein disulfide reductase [bacterium]|nr:TlpA family protein disulfide reductase [bacterium]